MKNFFNTNALTFLFIAIIGLAFTSCEPETIIETEFVDREVEVIVYQPADSIFVQTSPYGNITYTQIMQGTNVALQPGLNHYAHIDIENYNEFEIDMYFGLRPDTWINGNVFQDGAVIVQTNELGLSTDLDDDEFELDGFLNLGENQVSSFDIYINADLLSNSALTIPELYIRLRKEEYVGDENRLIQVRFDKDYVNGQNDEELGLIALNGETPIELYVDIDTEVLVFQGDPTLSEAEVIIEIEQESGDNLFLDVNSFEFTIDGINYNIQNLPSNVFISVDSTATQFPDAFLIGDNDDEEVEIVIVAPTGTSVILRSYSWSGENTNFSSLLHLNENIQM